VRDAPRFLQGVLPCLAVCEVSCSSCANGLAKTRVNTHLHAEVDRLVRDLESEICPFYLDLQPEMANLQVVLLKPDAHLWLFFCGQLVLMVYIKRRALWRLHLLLHQALVDRLKPLGSSLTLATTKSGSTHIQVVTPQLQLGAEFRDLAVLPATSKSDMAECT
jgi:hypothetical protein